MLYCVVDTSDWDTALASIPSTVYGGHILSGKNGCLTVYEGHTRMRLCVYSDCFIVQSLCCTSTRTSAIQGPTLQINHSERVCYELYTYSMEPQINFMEFKFLLWQLSQSLLCSAWCCEYFGVLSIFWCPPPPTAQGPIPLGSNLAG